MLHLSSRQIFFVLILFVALGCTPKEKVELSPVEKGRATYARHCTACHNVNPKLDGAVGPAIYGSSLQLLEYRILKGQYPPGYTAKRSTHIMPVLPFLKDDIPALHAYLNSP